MENGAIWIHGLDRSPSLSDSETLQPFLPLFWMCELHVRFNSPTFFSSHFQGLRFHPTQHPDPVIILWISASARSTWTPNMNFIVQPLMKGTSYYPRRLSLVFKTASSVLKYDWDFQSSGPFFYFLVFEPQTRLIFMTS